MSKAPTFDRKAVAALFLERQHLTRPQGRRFSKRALLDFVEDAGGLQIDSINVIDRAHYLTVWSRFGPYARTTLDRMVYRDRQLFEYWAHAACHVSTSHFPWWRHAMETYSTRHRGWGSWLKKNRPLMRSVEARIREEGPLGTSDFSHKPGTTGGWWNWKPAAHALDFLWMSGRTLVHSRKNFQKRFDLAERVMPEALDGKAPTRETFRRWHMERSLHAMGAATETDLHRYMTSPRTPAPERRKVLRALVADGTVREIKLDGVSARWYCLERDLDALAAAGRKRRASRGTTFLCPFDSLMWHRERLPVLFGFEYRIEVYVPAPKRTFGYYVLPILHDGHFIGRVDVKTHRDKGVLELRRVHFEDWFARGDEPAAARWGSIDTDEAIAGVAAAARSLAAFTGATEVKLGKAAPARFAARMRKALAG